MIPEYNYRVKDYSLVTPAFRDYVVQPLMKFIPWGLPANIITIISNSLMFLALYIALFASGKALSYSIIALLILLYAIGDHIDGMQAKRTKTGSALGEWFDHFLDSFNTGILLMILFAVFHITNLNIIVFMLAVNYLAHATVFYEQFKTGWLYFEKIGSLEVVIFSSLIIVFNGIQPVHHFLSINLAKNISIIEWLFLISAAGTFITFVKTAYRAKIAEFRFYLFIIFLTFVSLVLLKSADWITLCIMITLYSAYYIGSLMRGHLVDGKSYLPDFIIPVVLVICFFGKLLGDPVILQTILILQVAGVIYLFYMAVSTLRKFWVWRNPAGK